jgi:hypothetical protein
MHARRLLNLILAVVASLLASLACAAQAADCAVQPRDPLPTKAVCAINHANFLYAQACPNNRCSSRNPAVERAYQQAAQLFYLSHNDAATNPKDAYYLGFYEERSYQLAAANSSYLACTAARSNLSRHPDWTDSVKGCAQRIVLVNCAIQQSANCNSNGQQIANIRAVVQGAESSSAFSASQEADQIRQEPQYNTTSVEITMPPQADIDALRNSLTPQERAQFLATAHGQQLILKPVQSHN